MAKKSEWLFLGILLILSFAVKLIEVENPFYGDNSIRQFQTLSTIDYYVQNGIDLLNPRVSYAGWPGILRLEFPTFQAMAAMLSGFTENSLITTRMLNLGFVLLSLVMVYKIAELWFDREIAKYSMLFFAFAPLNLKYHPSLLIDVSNVTYALFANWLLLKYLKGQKSKSVLLLFTFFGALCVTMKALYFFPVATMLIYHYVNQAKRPAGPNLATYLKKNYAVYIAVFVIACIMTSWLAIASTLDVLRNSTLDWTIFEVKFYITNFYRLLECLLQNLEYPI